MSAMILLNGVANIGNLYETNKLSNIFFIRAQKNTSHIMDNCTLSGLIFLCTEKKLEREKPELLKSSIELTSHDFYS